MITASTGSGKSYFVKNILRDYLKENGQKCLYLLSRTRTREQFEKELLNDNIIRFNTYQAVESVLQSPLAFFNGSDFIVADECHYFTDDARFNPRTDISFDWIMSQNKSVRIFMTATPGGIKKFFDEKQISYTEYHFAGNYNNVKNLFFFRADKQLEILADKVVESGNKGLFFIQNAEKAYTLYDKYKDKGMFLCSRDHKKYAKFVDNDLVKKLLENERFECVLLFATTVIDVGVNLRDKTLTHVIIDVTEPNAVLQCLGRKRFIDESDSIDLYVHTRTNKQLGGLIQKLSSRLKSVSRFNNYGAVQYNAINERRNDNSGMIVDEVADIGESNEAKFVKKIQKLRLAQTKYDIEAYQKMLSLGDDGYIKYIADLLGKDDYTIIDDFQETQNLSQYLSSIVDVPMYTPKERAELIERLNVRHDGKLCRGYKTLSSWLQESRYPFRLESYRKTKVINGKKCQFKNVWVIVRLITDSKKVYQNGVKVLLEA